MWKGVLLLISFIFLSCNREDVIDPQLIGKWEAKYSFSINSDTTFYQKGTQFPCAYAILPYDYNSGFELIDESTGDLIWCGGNKSDFFKWSYKDQILEVEYEDSFYEIFIDERTNNSMQITLNHEEYFFMVKY